MIPETLVLQDLFPLEVTGKILQPLPLGLLVRFKCVDKELYQTVDTLFFFFPVKVIREILLSLLEKSLLCFKCANKKWFDLIHDPFFMGPHIQRSLDYYNDIARITFTFINHTGGPAIACYVLGLTHHKIAHSILATHQRVPLRNSQTQKAPLQH
ncbi:hypothetical protein Cgig2_003192 [Carnegiea gigantea]|uniref:F-box domain-containing protein n=1 Tax=Carnegiea gigantea TaxID=171969 RepID=A0A9Q1JMD6_9CARY|nr:hypothetical protein Cgig2_003192 [Carnegiea gigantea]